MFMRQLAASVVLILFSLAAPAQELADPAAPDRIENWTAPPYWTPPGISRLEPQKPEAGVFSPEAIEALPSTPLPFVAISPCRLLDTRNTLNPLGGGGPFAVDEIRTYTLPGACGLPAGIQAVSLNVTATNTGPGAFGHIKVWPADGVEPNVSTLNYPGAGETVANAAVVPLSSTGAMKAKSGNATADLILDVNGYYAPVGIVNTVNGLSGAVTLAAGTNISITPAGNSLTIANTAPAAWRLTGNSGTTAGTNFLGTTDNQALEVKVNNQRVMRFEPLGNVIGGSIGSVTAGVYSATISGGQMHLVTDAGGTVGGGSNNRAGDNAGTTTDRLVATVGGGNSNIAGGSFATVPGGQSNEALGAYSFAAGGRQNLAEANYSFAAGRRAQARHDGAFVWGDSTDADVASTGANQFVARARGGFTFYPDASTTCTLTSVAGWNCVGISDRNVKKGITPVNGRDTLARLVAMPIQTWSYVDDQLAVRHMGPMAQDFAAAYGLGSDDKKVNPIDANGVALAAIQGLYEEVQELRRRLAALEGAKD